jgi:hypothetical protein
MKNIFTLILAFVSGLVAVDAQGLDYERPLMDESKGVIYNKELAFDIRMHTYGFALSTSIGRIKTYYLTNYFHLEVGEIRHPKEQRQSFDYPSNGKTSRSFVYGKQNSFLVVRAGKGAKRYLSEKAKRKGVAVGINYEGGVALGILKPYYLDFWRSDSNNPSNVYIISEKYTGDNEDSFLDISRIYGSSGFLKGFNEISVVPGVQGKFGVHFAWGAFDEFVKAFEAGIMVDVFFKKIPIIVEVQNAENRPFFINLYLSLQLGKRW